MMTHWSQNIKTWKPSKEHTYIHCRPNADTYIYFACVQNMKSCDINIKVLQKAILGFKWLLDDKHAYIYLSIQWCVYVKRYTCVV